MRDSSTMSGRPGLGVADLQPTAARRVARGILGRRAARAVAGLVGLVGLALVVTTPARAQRGASDDPHSLAGSVRSADESRLVGAHVQLFVGSRTDAGATVVTESDGAFRFARVPDGSVRLVVRRLGFRPETLSVEMPQLAGGPVVVMLERVAQQLNPVVVSNARRAARLGSGFDRRRAAGFGHYLTREDIERRNPQRTSELLRGMAGVTVTGGGPRFRSVGNAAPCEPVYFLDGMPVGGGAFDLDAINPKSIESVEIYSGAATVPAALRSALTPGGCGAIAIWTRQGDTPRDALGVMAAVDSLDDMVARGWAYTADQVDMAALPLPGLGPAPAYPDSLLAAGVRGRVVAEFVVTEQGKVDAETVGIVSSTHPLFAAAVRDAVADARFSPAYRDHKVVRQVVHLPVVFDLPTPVAKAPASP